MTDPSTEALVQNLEARLRAAQEESAKLRETIVRQKADLDTIALVQTEQQERAKRSDYFIGEVAS
jgi:ABC-type uncharacterized transport system fused permease/ATPase subunit